MTFVTRIVALASSAFVPASAGCDTPVTTVVFDNDYSPTLPQRLTIYRASWENASFAAPIAPGASSEPQVVAAASENTAYVVLASGWDPASTILPTSLVVMQSREGFALHFDTTLHIPVDDTAFIGNCAADSFLSQSQADFITAFVFPNDFATLKYDAATCRTVSLGEGGGP